MVGTGARPTDSSRRGDFAEYYAITWLWDNGWEVFRNCGCTGPVDLIAMAGDKITLIDVKTRGKGRGHRGRTQQQKDLGVQFLTFDPDLRSLRFTEHKE